MFKQKSIENDSSKRQWSDPPTDYVTIDFIFYVNNVSEIDIAKGSACVDVGVCFYWTDERMKDYLVGKKLPENLWSPCINLWNAKGVADVEHKDFYVVDSGKGLLSKTTRYIACCDIKDDPSFDAFPFDLCTVNLKFSNAGVGVLVDGTKTYDARAADKLIYALFPSMDKKFPLYQFWTFGGDLVDWVMLGCSCECEDTKALSLASVQKLSLNFHFSRRSTYYVYKMILPMAILNILSFTVFYFDISDIATRINYLVTVMLSNFALLFVIQDDVPRGDKLTTIDKLYVIALLGTVACCLISIYVKNTNDQYFNDTSGLAVTILYLVGFFEIVLHAIQNAVKYRSEVQKSPHYKTRTMIRAEHPV